MLTRRATSGSDPENSTLRFLTWVVFFFASFFGGFYILGYINLATDLPVVDTFYASIVALVVFVGFGPWLTKRRPSPVRPGGNAERSHGSGFRLSLPPANGLGRTLALAGIVIFVLTALMLGTGFPRGYEPQAYHLPIAVHIFQ